MDLIENGFYSLSDAVTCIHERVQSDHSRKLLFSSHSRAEELFIFTLTSRLICTPGS